MATTLQEFEAICVELQSNPGEATKSIESFRDQEYALEACHTWIRTPGCSAIAQFQLALVIQYSSLRNWSYLPTETVASLRETLWGLIETAVASGSMPTFALNKVILVFVLLWKRGWKDGSTTDQESLFQRISGFLGTAQLQGGGAATASGNIANPDAFKYGPLILRVLLEEFNNVNTTEIALPLEFHEKSHKKYEQYGLGESLRLCMGCLTVSYQQIAESEGTALTSSTINVVAESVKLFTELLHWNFDSLSNKGQSKANLLSLPRTWAAAIIEANVIEGTYSVYDKLRALCVHLASQPPIATQGAGGTGVIRKVDPAEAARQQTLKDTVSCMSEIRVLMITLSSISGSPFFQSDEERVGYGDSLMARTKSLLEASVSSGNQEIQAHSSFAVLMEELRSRECESFSSTFLRLLGNFRLALCFRMPTFTPMLLQLGHSTHQLAAEIKARVTVSVEKIRNGQDWNDEESMFLGWRGEALALLFDSWCIILDDPTMQRAAHDNNNNNVDSSSGGNGALTAPQLQQLKADMAQMAQQVYRELFECYYLSVVHEALMGVDEDEDEDEENIESRNKEEILACIGTIGRSALVPSLECIVTAMHSACQEVEVLAAALASGAGMTAQTEADRLRVLEMMRIVTLFGCHLFAEDFTTDPTATGPSSAEADILPQGVLDEGAATPVARNSVLQLYWCFHNCLQQQMQLAEVSNGMHPLVSPYLLQHLFRVLGEYCLRFLDPDTSLYYEQGGNPLLRLHGSDFNSSVEVLLTSCRQVIVSMPLENELVLSVASLITAMSKSSQPQRLAFILNCGAVTDIFRLLSGGAEEGCRLNENGLSAVFRALSCVAITAKNEHVFMQLCTHVHGIASQLAMVQQRGGKLTSEDQKVVSNLVACLQGMCATPSGLDKIIRELFDFVLPVVAWCVQQFASLRADDVSTSILLLVRDYADHKLMGLPQASSLVLYRASLDTMNVMLASLDFHAQNASSSGQGGGASEEEREEFRSDTILRLLQLLNILASKDFFLDCEEDVVAAIAASGTMNPNTGQTTAQSEICRVLIIGFQSIVPLLSADLLRTHPACCDRYFSFTTFVLNTYIENLDEMLSVDHGVDNDDKTSFFVTLMQHLLWGAGAIDSSAARQALKSIQAIADYYFTGLRAGTVSAKGGPGNNIGPAAAGAIFPLAVTRLLEMIFYPNTCEYGIAQDRMDACGNALITLIALDSNRFHQCAHAIVSQFAKQHPSAEQPLLSCFKKLMEDRGVNMGAIDKRNRQTFCMNFRDFILAVRPVVKG
jgi:hypothetical protein